MEDRALADAVLAGERDRFATFVERETPAVYRVCLRILGQQHDAEDVTQEAFIAAFRAIGTYRGEGSMRAWLMRIATRLAFRRLAQRRGGDPLDPELHGRLSDDPAAEPAAALIRAERRDAVREAVARLPDRYREIVALRFFAELSLADVSEATGRPLNTVKTHLRRGLERLHPILDEGGDR